MEMSEITRCSRIPTAEETISDIHLCGPGKYLACMYDGKWWLGPVIKKNKQKKPPTFDVDEACTWAGTCIHPPACLHKVSTWLIPQTQEMEDTAGATCTRIKKNCWSHQWLFSQHSWWMNDNELGKKSCFWCYRVLEQGPCNFWMRWNFIHVIKIWLRENRE